jgi:hypothetical protein
MRRADGETSPLLPRVWKDRIEEGRVQVMCDMQDDCCGCDCQRSAWKQHKKECVSLAAANTESAMN